jgi:lipoprotein-releasing system permease protein
VSILSGMADSTPIKCDTDVSPVKVDSENMARRPCPIARHVPGNIFGFPLSNPFFVCLDICAMRLELFIARRHLMSRERHALLSIITLISILGVVVGVTALIAVNAVMDGADEGYLANIIDQYSHIQIGSPYGEIRYYDRVLEIVRSDPDVVAASPSLQRFAMLKLDAEFADSRTMAPSQLLGIDSKEEVKVSRIGASGHGKSVGKTDPDDHEIVLGKILAERLGVMPGDTVFALTGAMAQTANGPVAKQSKLRVVGVFESGIYQIDEMTSYVSLPTCRKINVLGDVVDLVCVRLKDPNLAPAVQKRLRAQLKQEFGELYVVRTWSELNPELFKALALEKLAMFVILLLVVMVASLNIIATLVLVTMEKTREIGVLRAMGASRRSIQAIFVLDGGLIGIVGSGLGVLCGLGVCWILQNCLPKDIIPAAVYGLDGLPVLVKPMTIVVIVASSMTICLLASVIPAYLASRLNVVEALRHE